MFFDGPCTTGRCLSEVFCEAEAASLDRKGKAALDPPQILSCLHLGLCALQHEVVKLLRSAKLYQEVTRLLHRGKLNHGQSKGFNKPSDEHRRCGKALRAVVCSLLRKFEHLRLRRNILQSFRSQTDEYLKALEVVSEGQLSVTACCTG